MGVTRVGVTYTVWPWVCARVPVGDRHDRVWPCDRVCVTGMTVCVCVCLPCPRLKVAKQTGRSVPNIAKRYAELKKLLKSHGK